MSLVDSSAGSPQCAHLRGTDIYLRSIEECDVEAFYKWQNSPALYDSLLGVFVPVSRHTVTEWVRAKSKWSESEINLVICESDTDSQIGATYLRKIDRLQRHAELHIYLGDAANRGRGMGRSACALVLQYAFNALGLHRVHLEVLESNHCAVALYESLGFKLEGKLRQHVFKQGVPVDVLVMGVLRPEFTVGCQ